MAKTILKKRIRDMQPKVVITGDIVTEAEVFDDILKHLENEKKKKEESIEQLDTPPPDMK
jgi:NDP-sugar pyrophosphorylase family protein